MQSVALEQDLLCRVLGRCEFGAEIDGEIGGLTGDRDDPRRGETGRLELRPL